MRLTFLRQIGTALVIGMGLGSAAMAQSQACNAWRSELASLQSQRGDARAAQAAQRVGGQLSQAINRYRAMGCERGGFLFFGEAPPPQCGGLRAQINQLQSQYTSLQQRASGGGLEQRRAQLSAMINQNCQGAPQQRGFFETIFGTDPGRGGVDSTMPELDPTPTEPERPRMGGAYTVCVRTCDGYFFPLANNPGGRGGPDEMCQALCPGTETMAFGMTQGGDVQNAVSRSTGQPYSSLPNAARYTRSFDPACTCRGNGESWSQALRNAEQMLEQRRGDVIVTEQRAAEMSRPRADTRRQAQQPAGARPPAPAAPQEEETPMPSENSPTASTESAGVGPQVIEGERTVQQGDGLRRESTSTTGERRAVRIVAPNLAPQLSPAARP